MSNEAAEATQPKNVLTWGSILNITQRAALKEVEEKKETVVACGPLAWMGVRHLCEERLRSPLLGDILVIDTIEWYLSMHVDKREIQIVNAADLRQDIPLVITKLPPNDLTHLGGNFDG